LLHKDAVESTTSHSKKAISAILMMPSRSHYWVDPVDDIDLTPIALLAGV
jgi:hypothetical protein